jgi:hypothetical protein
MAASPIIIGPLPVQRGSAAAGGGTFVATIVTSLAPYTNRVVRIRFEIYLSDNIGGPLANGAAYLCEAVVANKNGVVTFLTAIATSSNPVDSDTVGFELTSRPVASDAAFNTATAHLTIDGGNDLLCTVTNNNGGGIAADVIIVPTVTVCGSV